jgi:hypothetical protein
VFCRMTDSSTNARYRQNENEQSGPWGRLERNLILKMRSGNYRVNLIILWYVVYSHGLWLFDVVICTIYSHGLYLFMCVTLIKLLWLAEIFNKFNTKATVLYDMILDKILCKIVVCTSLFIGCLQKYILEWPCVVLMHFQKQLAENNK